MILTLINFNNVILYVPYLHHTILCQGLEVHARIDLLITQYTLPLTERHLLYEWFTCNTCLPYELVLAIISELSEPWFPLKHTTQSFAVLSSDFS